MTLFQAILYGLIQGLTEFLPISSTAHIRILPALLNWQDPGAAFTAVIQFGTMVAVIIYFWRDIQRMIIATISGIVRGHPLAAPDSVMAWMIVAGTIPIVICGVLFKHSIETTLRSLYVIIASMIALAIFLMIAELFERRRTRRGIELKDLDHIGWREAITIGFWQAVALIPGSSRSGVTLTGGLFLGLRRETAARFSFLLSLPSVFAAGMFEMYRQRNELLSSEIGFLNLLIATIVSGIVGYLSIAFLLNYLKTHTTTLFIVYRLIVGIALLILVLTNSIVP